MHWFTATPDPHKSVFKLAPGFGLLSKEGKLSEATKSKKSYPEKVVSVCKVCCVHFAFHSETDLPAAGAFRARTRTVGQLCPQKIRFFHLQGSLGEAL